MTRWKHSPAPAYSPVRDQDYRTELPELMRVARGLGWNLMPHQRHVLEIATEYKIGPDGVKRYKYHDIVTSLPRQSGKTTLMGPLMLYRILTRPRTSVFYTAQTGQSASFRIKEYIDRYSDPSVSAFAKHLQPHFSAGAEGIRCPANRSFLRRFSPTKSALHGETPNLVVVDEFWIFNALQGEELTGAIDPGQITIRDQSQTWWISTMGTASSTFMNDMVKTGREGSDPRMAYFEWSLPDGADPDNPDDWGFHPALGNTISLSDLTDAYNKQKATGDMGKWNRAYMNRMTGAANPLIPERMWDGMAVEAMDVPKDFVISYEVAPENAFSTVVASWRDEHGEPYTRVLYQAPGTAWVPDFIADCHKHWRPSCIAADDGGPTRRITGEIQKKHRRVKIETLSMPEFGSACMGWLEAARDVGNLHHDGSEALRSAVMSASIRTREGVSRFSRDDAVDSVAALIASAVALWAFDNRRKTHTGIVT